MSEPDARDEALRLLGSAVLAWHRAGRYGDLAVEGRSMLPTLPGQSHVWFVPTTETPLRRGHLLLFRQERILVVHRALRRRADGTWLTKGDGRITFDADAVGSAEIVGRVVAFRRGERTLSLEGRGARLYGVSVGLYSELAGHLYRLAGRCDAVLGRLAGGRPARPLRRLVGAADRVAMRAVDFLLFRPLHAPWSPPPVTPSDADEPPPTEGPAGRTG